MGHARLAFLIAITAFIGLAEISSAVAGHRSQLPTYKTSPEDFFYAHQTSLWAFYKVDKNVLQRQVGSALEHLGLDLVSFEDPSVGYMILKPMVFMAEFGAQNAAMRGTSASTEVEFTVLVRPKKTTARARGTFDDFLRGHLDDPNIGQLRLDVLCDNEVAVAAGRKNFGEHKFLGSFEYNYPVPNGNLGKEPPFSFELTAYTWQGAGATDRKIFHLKVDLKGATRVKSAFSPEVLYSSFPPEPSSTNAVQKLVGENRFYRNKLFAAYIAVAQSKLDFGAANGGAPLKPVPPFGDSVEITG